MIKLQEGLVFVDPVGRADSPGPGLDWIERAGDWPVEDGWVVNQSGGVVYLEEGGADPGGEMFVQAILGGTGFGTFTRAVIHARWDWNGGSPNSYRLLYNAASGRLTLFRTVNGTATAIAEGGVFATGGGGSPFQLYVADGIQRSRCFGTNGWGFRNAVDDAHDEANSRTFAIEANRFGGQTTRVGFPAAMRCRNNLIRVVAPGGQSGWTLRLLDGSENVVREVTAEEGEAVIDVLEIPNGAHGTGAVPVGGWAALAILIPDGGGLTEAERYDAEGVYPGTTFEAESALPFSPHAPLIDATASGRDVIIDTGTFSTQDPEGIHTETLYQIKLSSEPNWANAIVNDLTSVHLITNVYEDQPAATLLDVRAFHGSDGLFSPPSNVVQVETGAETPRPDQPTMSLVEVGEDFSRLRLSAFAHAEGVTTAEDFDEEEPLPYPIAAQIQVQEAGGDWDENSLIYDSGLVSFLVPDPEVLVTDQTPGTSYQTRGRWQDGHHQTTSPWSPVLSYQTDPEPPVRPGTPLITLEACDGIELGKILVSAGTFVPHENGGQTLARRHWRLRYEAGSNSAVVVGTGGQDLEEMEWDHLPFGEYALAVRDEDSEGFLSLWSDEVLCFLLPTPLQPVITDPVSGIATSTDQMMRWIMPEMTNLDPQPDWTFEVQRFLNGAWEQVMVGTTDQEYLIEEAGLPAGEHQVRVRACYPAEDGGFCGEWAYLFIHIDRTGAGSKSVDFTRLEELDPEWHWLFDDRDLAAYLIDECPGAEDNEENPIPSIGLMLQHERHNTDRRGVFVFPEFGQPDTGEFTAVFGIFQPTVWYGWKFSHSPFLSGGIGVRVDGTRPGTSEEPPRQGLFVAADAGAQPWMCGACGCDPTSGSCPPCTNCYKQSCGVCRDCGPVTANLALTNRTQSYQYAWGTGQAGMSHRAWRNGSSRNFHNVGTRLQQVGIRNRGLRLSTYPMCHQCRDIWWYQARVVLTRQGPDLQIATRITGPGLDPDQGVQNVSIIQNVDGNLPCGYCGLAIRSLYGVAGRGGIVFRSFTMANATYLPECVGEAAACPEEAVSYGEWVVGLAP